jgi:hypothetical protein
MRYQRGVAVRTQWRTKKALQRNYHGYTSYISSVTLAHVL